MKPRREAITSGPLTVLADFDSADRLVSVQLPKRIPPNLSADDLAGVIAQLQKPVLTVDPAPPFHRRVWAKLRTIPWGEKRTYGRIAASLRNPRASRAVGQACAANRLALIIPCHRVVGVAGPGGFAWGLAWKAKLLELESTPGSAG
jgi:O-6-methylguanine DNA methyltransferase